MAYLVLPEEGNRRIDDLDDVTAYLAPLGIRYGRWPVEGRCSPDAPAEDVLAAYRPEIERLQMQEGYVAADVVSLTPDTPGLEDILEQIGREHTHSEDEVRFVLKGHGVFYIAPEFGAILALHLEAGDFLIVPAGTKHWMHLTEERTFRAIRLFQNHAGWVPYYVDEGRHTLFPPPIRAATRTGERRAPSERPVFVG